MTDLGRVVPLGSDMPEMRTSAERQGVLLSIVVPVFNEEEAVEIFLAELDAHAPAIHQALGPGGRFEALFVNDGSRDRTAEILTRVALERADVGLISLSRNFGKDAALGAGLAHARGDIVLPMDVDLQDPPSIIAEMIDCWKKGAKLVNARRRRRDADGWLKRQSASGYYRVYNRVADHPIQDNVGDFRLLDRSIVDVLNAMPERIRFMKGLFSWVGFAQATVEYDRPSRAAGTTKWAYWRLWNFALDGITGSTTLPLRIWTYVGLGVAAFATLYAAFIILRTLILGVDSPGYASLMVVMLFFGATNMISVGLLGEYVGRIAVEVRQRPLYLVERKVGAPVTSSVMELSSQHPSQLDQPNGSGTPESRRAWRDEIRIDGPGVVA